MTDLSTLLHAAARGARIQVFNALGSWVTVELVVVANKHVPEYRIHPDDEHLMWGPLSRKYYERALYGDAWKFADEVKTKYLHFVSMDCDEWFAHYAEADEPTRRMILLTIALALRDEGM